MDLVKEYNKTFQLIEQWRYKHDIERMVHLFLEDWAFKHTGLYSPNDNITSTKEFTRIAIPLSHILSNLMLHGVSDPLATILTEYCKGHSKHLAYYPTPQSVTSLISSLMTSGNQNATSDDISIYEPCVGTSGIVLQHIEQTYLDRLHLDRPMQGVSITVEDINCYALYAFVVQLIHKIQYLSGFGGKPAEPDTIIINQVNVLSRKCGRVNYLFTQNKG